MITVFHHSKTKSRLAASSLGVHRRRVWAEQGGVAGHPQAEPPAAGALAYPDRALLAAWPGAVEQPLQQLAEGLVASLLVPLDRL